jgi:Sigma-70, region 4
MSAIDDLSPDQRAVLQLVLRQGRSYDQLAGMLGIDRDAVAARAHAGLEAVAPDAARRLSPERRGQIADYLLGQQDDVAAAETRGYLAGSASARAFARLVADAIEPVSRDPLPDIPAPATAAPAEPAPPLPPDEREAAGDIDTPPPVPPPAPAAPAGPRSSRLGGVLILALVAAIIAVVVIIIVNHNSGGSDNASATQTTSTPATTASTTPSTTSTTPVVPKAQINLNALQTGSKAVGLAQVVTQGGQEAIALAAQHVAPNQNNAYAVWLYSSQNDAKFLGWINSQVGSNGQFTALIPPGSLPANAKHFKYLVVSLEPVSQNQKTAPSKPTQLILRGRLKL